MKGTWFPHGALILTQVLFGGGSVVGKLGLSNHTNPVFFALLREGIAGPLLVLIAFLLRGRMSNIWFISGSKDHWRLVLTGGMLFVNQLLYIVGLKLSSSTTASVWQPSQPIFTLGLAIALRLEKPTIPKVIGIMCAIGGAVFMILFDVPISELSSSLIGNLCFCGNCAATSSYVIFTKPLLKQYSGLVVCAWSYIVAMSCMLLTAIVITTNDVALNFVCPDCDGFGWDVPTMAIWALAYWVILQSVAAWGLMTWANKYVDGSVCSAYTVLQPLSTDVITCILVVCGVGGLSYPGYNELGAIGIVIGLAIVLYEQRHLMLKSKSVLQAEPLTPSIPGDTPRFYRRHSLEQSVHDDEDDDLQDTPSLSYAYQTEAMINDVHGVDGSGPTGTPVFSPINHSPDGHHYSDENG